MAKFTVRYHKTGTEEEFEFDGTRQNFIDAKFGIGGVNATFATVTEVETEAPSKEAKETIVQKVKKALK